MWVITHSIHMFYVSNVSIASNASNYSHYLHDFMQVMWVITYIICNICDICMILIFEYFESCNDPMWVIWGGFELSISSMRVMRVFKLRRGKVASTSRELSMQVYSSIWISQNIFFDIWARFYFSVDYMSYQSFECWLYELSTPELSTYWVVDKMSVNYMSCRSYECWL